MRFRRDESGQILVITALGMTVLFGCMALAIDVGLLFNAHRKLQNAVDAAATSGAIDYMFNADHTKATAAATAALAANGFSVTPTVHFYPNITSTYHNNGDYYVQVIATAPSPTFFLSVFDGMFKRTSGQQSINIGAMAIAGMPGQGNACVIVLDPTDDGALTLQGSFTVDAGGCGVVVDSTSSSALTFTGNGGSLDAKYVSVVGSGGGGGVSGYHTGESTPAPTTGAAPVINPFPGVTGPPTSGANAVCTAANSNALQSYTGTPTILSSGGVTCFTYPPTAHGAGSSPVSLSNMTLPPGLVVFTHGVTLGGTIRSGSGGTTMDNDGGTFTVSTNTNLALTAPSVTDPAVPLSGGTGAGAWSVPQGFALIQPSSNTNRVNLQTGSSCGTLTGIIYVPNAELYLNDSGGDNCGGTGFGDASYDTDLIVYKLTDQTATLNISNYNSSLGATGPLTAVALVE